MSATLKLTHKAIGAQVGRSTYDVVVDMDEIQAALKSLTPAEEEIVAFRCTGKMFLPILLASLLCPGWR